MRRNKNSGTTNLEALFGARQGEQPVSGLRMVDRERIQVKSQPRTSFPAEALDELTNSISQLRERGEGIQGCGILQPLLVSPDEDGNGYRLVAGERRFRAAERAGLQQVPALVLPVRREGVLLAQLIENLQRQDLMPLEEARSLRQLMEEQNLSYRDAARLLGKTRGYLETRLALLKVGPDVQALVNERADTMVHARLLDNVEDPKLRRELIEATRDGASVAEIRQRIEPGLKREEEVSERSDRGGQRATPPSGNRDSQKDGKVSERSDTPQKPDSQLDPLAQCLEPAVAFLAEGARQLEAGNFSRRYAKEIRGHLEQAREQIARIEKMVV